MKDINSKFAFYVKVPHARLLASPSTSPCRPMLAVGRHLHLLTHLFWLFLLPLFLSLWQSNQQSRTTLTQTNYQLDFGTGFFKLSTQGAKFDVERYYHPIPKQGRPKKL